MRYILLTVGITLIVATGFAIDASSRPVVKTPAFQSGPARIYAPGRVEGATPQIELRPQLAGRVVKVLVQEGQYVQKGDLLLQLDDQTYRHQVELNSSQVALAEAKLQRLLNGAHTQQRSEAAALYRAKLEKLHVAQLVWDRYKPLLESNSVSEQEADDKLSLVTALTAEVEAAQARQKLLDSEARPDEVKIEESLISTAKANLELARVQLERTSLRAPSSGQILKVDIQVGELTGPETVEPTIVMVDTSRFFVKAFIEEMDAPQVKVGMTATLTADGLPGKKIPSRVVRLSPLMSRKVLFTDKPSERYDTKTREVWLELDDTNDLVVGLRVDVVIVPPEYENER